MKLSTLKMIGKSKWEELQHLLEGIAIIVPVFDAIRDSEFCTFQLLKLQNGIHFLNKYFRHNRHQF